MKTMTRESRMRSGMATQRRKMSAEEKAMMEKMAKQMGIHPSQVVVKEDIVTRCVSCGKNTKSHPVLKGFMCHECFENDEIDIEAKTVSAGKN